MNPQNQPKRPPGFTRQFAVVMELPFVLVGPVLVGGFVGFLFDRWLGTNPFLMLAVGGLGFYAGVRELSRRAGKLENGPNEDARR